MQTANESGETVIVARYMGHVAISRVAVPAEKLLPPESYAKLSVRNEIDKLVYARLQKLGHLPSETCSDAEFLRRHTDRVTKFALPSPFMIRVRYWHEDFSSAVYPTPQHFMEDITRVLAHEAKALGQAGADVESLDHQGCLFGWWVRAGGALAFWPSLLVTQRANWGLKLTMWLRAARLMLMCWHRSACLCWMVWAR